jgi:trehalose 6-phosphate phosphatase
MSWDPSAVATEIRADLAHALVAVDFDGTLAPIVRDPADSRPAPGAVDALRRLVERGATVAIVTGRNARTVVELGGLDTVPGLRVSGLYGAEEWQDGNLDLPEEPPPLAKLRSRLPGALAEAGADPDVWIEDKRLSLVVHARKTADPAAALARLTEPVTALATELGLEIHPGRDVLEVRLPGYDKGSALRRLIAETGPRRLVFIGDDVGDLPAFSVVAQLRASGMPAWSIAVQSEEVPAIAAAADVVVTGPDQVVELLAAIAR